MRRMVARRSDLVRLGQRRRGGWLAERYSLGKSPSTSSCVAIGFCIARAKNASDVSHTSLERPRGVCLLFVSGIASFRMQRCPPAAAAYRSVGQPLHHYPSVSRPPQLRASVAQSAHGGDRANTSHK